MRFVIITSSYPQFLDWLYHDAQPGLSAQGFAEQRQAYYATLFATSDFYAHALERLGHQVEEFIYNCDPMQLAWRREHRAAAAPESGTAGLALLTNAGQVLLERLDALKRRATRSGLRRWLAPVARPLLGRVHAAAGYGFPLLLEQVRHCRPDIVLIQSLYAFDNEQLRAFKRYGARLVGEQAVMPIAEHIDYRLYDLVVSSFPPIVEWMRAHGVRAELNRLAFEPRVDRLVPPMSRDILVSFVGSVFPMHRSRLGLLEAVARAVPEIAIHGNITIAVAPDSPVRGRIGPPLWGRDMYRLLRRSQLTLNHHGDVLPYANNMRLYEATGMGCLLVTDYKENLAEIFEPEKEVVTYCDAAECVDKVRFYSDTRNAPACKAIAAAGRSRVLREHNYLSRMRRLIDLIGEVC